MSLAEKIDKSKLPLHIAVIMDGNGRWALKQGKDRTFGHQNGVEAVRESSEAAAELGVKYLTLYAFSTENWKRPKYEIDALMKLLVQTIDQEIPTLNKNKIRLNAIGDLKSLPPDSSKRLEEAIEETSGNDRMTLTLALSYSSRWEIENAIKQIAHEVQTGKLQPRDIDCNLISRNLTTKDIPDPELLIRTSGEYRISNFLLWQIAYSELYFTNVLWPDFRKEDLYKAIMDYQCRERRFGKISEQLKKA
ncbi:MAG: isoprenyl transferase [Bacteroidales bacterium]|nr:isoprenyl transferase [Bacteroidales bacterium]MCF8344551.1 isoprenyl transferase [Bacteroidales bacterium]MCF8352246.1 isoprenyl transferase [Bacteroidales bacterium]MCF8374769.1 isoprenyl transferase [Bacteroidales bacterium]MCF8399827.1 isoprenyl transferase [Bacteroidales bacterium]